MPKLKILIVEDDFSYAIDLEMLISELDYDLVGIDTNAEEALISTEEREPDLVIVDITLKGKKDGIEFAKHLKKEGIPIIFISQSKDPKLYERAKTVSPVAYLVKPFDKLTLQSSIDNAIKFFALDNKSLISPSGGMDDFLIKNSFFIRNNNTLVNVSFSEILWIQSEGNYSLLHTLNKKYAVKISLTKIIQKLPKDQFLRVHQRYIVQSGKIKRIDVFENTLQLNDQTFPIGRTYREVILNRLNRL